MQKFSTAITWPLYNMVRSVGSITTRDVNKKSINGVCRNQVEWWMVDESRWNLLESYKWQGWYERLACPTICARWFRIAQGL